MIERYSDIEAHNEDDRINARTPLLERPRHHWVDEKARANDEERDLESSRERRCAPVTHKVALVRRFRRMLVIGLLVLALVTLAWRWSLWSESQEDREMMEGFMAAEDNTYDMAKTGHFDGTRIEELSAKYLPGSGHDPNGKRRLVFVGDIHGCSKELKKLLHKVQFDESRDHLVAVGDVISKGRDNVGVLDELIRLDATSVRGNHEDRILAIAPSVVEAESESDLEALSSGAKKDRKLLKYLHKRHMKFLRNMPLMLRIPALPLATTSSHKDSSPIAEEIIVVHAGLVPAVKLEKQDPFYVMNMRAIGTKKHKPMEEAASKHGKSKPWHDIWDWYNDRLYRKKSVKDFRVWDELEDVEPTGWNTVLGRLGLKSRKKWPAPQVVVYGHHSKAGLQVERWSKGLDTGCVAGGKLTAMVLDARGKWSLEHVGCKDRR
jgi:hypothetical protein